MRRRCGAPSTSSSGDLVHLERGAGRFRGAGVLPAADGAGSWIVGLDDAGRLLRLKGRSSFEAVSDRYGLEGTAVLGAFALGGAGAAFALPGEVAMDREARRGSTFPRARRGGRVEAGHRAPGARRADHAAARTRPLRRGSSERPPVDRGVSGGPRGAMILLSRRDLALHMTRPRVLDRRFTDRRSRPPHALPKLLDLDDDTRKVVEDLVPRFRIVLDDISQVDDAALLRRPMTPLGRVVLLLLRHSRNAQQLFERLALVAGLLVEVAQGVDGGAAIAALLVSLQRVTGRDEEQVGMALQRALGESDYEQILKAGERLEAKGLQRGLQRQRGMFLRLLQVRFGELPAWALARVDAADPDTLDKWAEQLLGVSSLIELLGDGGQGGKHTRSKPSRTAARQRKPPR
jgi:hypothetical protein